MSQYVCGSFCSVQCSKHSKTFTWYIIPDMYRTAVPSVWSLLTSLWPVGWTNRRTDRTSKHRPCPRDSACALSACLLRFSFFLSFFLFCFFNPLCVFLSFFPFFFECTYSYIIPWIFSWCYSVASGTDGIPQLVSTGPLTDWYNTAVLFFVRACFLPSRCIFVAACLLIVITGRISGR